MLVVEAADTSLRYDQTAKAKLYAEGGVPEYWIVNLNARELEVYRNPGPDPSRPASVVYGSHAVLGPEAEIAPLTRPEVALGVVDMLP